MSIIILVFFDLQYLNKCNKISKPTRIFEKSCSLLVQIFNIYYILE